MSDSFSGRNLWGSLLLAVALLMHWVKMASPGLSLLPNFSPWLGLCFAGVALLGGHMPWWLAPLLLLVTQVASLGLGVALAGQGILMLVFHCLCAGLGRCLRGAVTPFRAVVHTAGLSLLYYVLSNTLAWWQNPSYAQDLTGLIQAQTTGLPGFPPAWMFLRNALLGDVFFASLIALACSADLSAAKARTRAESI